jgi:hypothetical protein
MGTPFLLLLLVSWFSFLVQFFGLFQLRTVPAAMGMAAFGIQLQTANPAMFPSGGYCDKRSAGTKHDRGEKIK